MRQGARGRVSTLPLHVYRRTPQGRLPAGENARAVQLLNRPAPGSTGVDLISQVMVHLNVYGEAFVGKYRADGEIVQLGLIPPETVQVELRGQRIVYTLTRRRGSSKTARRRPAHQGHEPRRAPRPVAGDAVPGRARALLEPAAVREDVHRAGLEALGHPDARRRQRRPARAAQRVVARSGTPAWSTCTASRSLSGDIKFTPIGFSQDDAQFLQQRELSAREVARIFRVPAWAIDAPTGDSLTYANVAEQNRALVTHSLRPWLVRIERAITNDPDLCPGGTYVQFDSTGCCARTRRRAPRRTRRRSTRRPAGCAAPRSASSRISHPKRSAHRESSDSPAPSRTAPRRSPRRPRRPSTAASCAA